jgi:methionine synthase I (cobalamin-dependent)
VKLGGQFAVLLRDHPQLTVLGGCCGTDHRPIEQIGRAVKAAA